MGYLNKHFDDYNKLRDYFMFYVNKSIKSALEFSEEKHKGQERFNHTPYVIHPLRVSIFILKNLGFYDDELLISALLHDVLEDTNTTKVEIKKEFGKNVLKIVDNLTKRRNENDKAYINRVLKNRKSRIIKFSDVLDNLRSLEHTGLLGLNKEKYENLVKKYDFYLRMLVERDVFGDYSFSIRYFKKNKLRRFKKTFINNIYKV